MEKRLDQLAIAGITTAIVTTITAIVAPPLPVRVAVFGVAVFTLVVALFVVPTLWFDR